MKSVGLLGVGIFVVGLITGCGSSSTSAGGGGNSSTGPLTCAQGQQACSGMCMNVQTDNANCGTCGKVCPQGEACSAGTCGTTCLANEKLCTPDGGPSFCANVETDNANCGACGATCTSGTSCVSGACVAAVNASSCSPHEVLCGADGGAPDAGGAYCASTQIDISNCGACGTICGSTNATPVCQQGKCSEVCAQGFSDCDNNAANGCETATGTDKNNCGTCGNSCGGNVPCTKGACGYPECTSASPYNADGFRVSQTIGGATGEENLGTTPTWYRFTGTSTDMLTTAPTQINLCGAGVMGWINGTLPTNLATTSLRVCFAPDPQNTCTANTMIQVTNCGTYNVYQVANPALTTNIPASSYCMQ